MGSSEWTWVSQALGEKDDAVQFELLVQLVSKLRGENGCPWDKAQSHSTMARYLLEETYEVLEAIEHNDRQALREELGDLLFHVVFHSRIAEEHHDFTIYDVCRSIIIKMIRRHPHVFNKREDEGEDISTPTPLPAWEVVKKHEKSLRGKAGSLMDGIPASLPALQRCSRVLERASEVGFRWPDYSSALAKVYEELEELKDILNRTEAHLEPGGGTGGSDTSIGRLEEELGDLILALAGIAQRMGVDLERAGRRAADKFIQRFQRMEQESRLPLDKLTPAQLVSLWEEAKS